MSSNKRELSSDDESDSNKKAKPTITKDSKFKIGQFLNSTRQVQVCEFANQTLVNVREWYADKTTGGDKPGNKGSALTLEQWENLKELMPDIKRAADANRTEQFDIGSMKRVQVSLYKGAMWVDIREYFEDKKTKEVKPGNKGINLTLEQWINLTDQVENIDDAIALHTAA